jgi:parallel beta-helix repeat protein
VILVHEGTYTGDITINVDGLQLIAGSRPVIDGDLIVNADNVTVQGFEVTGVLETTPGSFQNLTLTDTQIYGEVFNTSLSCNDVVNDGESIQTAIDTVGVGSTVCVGPGTYTEQISIGKDLTLQAIAGTPTIQAPPSGTRTTYTIPESTATFDPIVFARGSGAAVVNVSISGFEIDGQSDYGPTSTRYVGVLYRNVAGAIADNVVKDLGHNGTQTFGILVYGNSNVIISNNDVSNYGRGGIVANGDLASSPYPFPLGPNPDPIVVIQGNIVTGPGATAPQTWASNGIQISWGATGSILDNEVIGNGWPGTAWAGTGILVVDASGVVIEGNNVHDNESAIGAGQFYATPVTGIVIRNNTVDNNEWGINVFNNASNTIVEDNTVTNQSGDGIDVWNYGWPWTSDPTGTEIHNNSIVGSGWDGAWTNVTAEVVDMENNWWGSAAGPYDPANDAGETTEVPPCTASPASEINADGLGDSIGDTSTEVIDYCPWLSSAPAGVSLLAVPLAPRSRSVKSENPSVAQPIE